jgi:DNA polymerase I-like protein with 3'-5' exonuclease and polymerase domains
MMLESEQWEVQRNFIVGADWSQLENRIIAILSGDPVLLGWYAKDVDVHCETAKILFELPASLPAKYWKAGAVCRYAKCVVFDQPIWSKPAGELCFECGHELREWTVGPTQRQIAKGARYAFHYLASEATMLAQLSAVWPDLGLSDVRRLRKSLSKLHSVLAKWQKDQHRVARQNGYVEAPLSGRRLQFYGEVDTNKLANIPIQSTGADLANRAVESLVDALAIDIAHGCNDREEALVVQLHDAIYLEGPDPFRLWDALQDSMAVTVELNGQAMHFPIDCGIGWTWAIEKVKDRDALPQAVLQLLREGAGQGYATRVGRKWKSGGQR